MNAILDPSFVRGNDAIVIFGRSSNYDISATVAGVTITSDNGANIRIPAFGTGGGLEIIFNDGQFELGTDDGGNTFQLNGAAGSQEIGNAAVAIGSGGSGGTGTAVSLDVGTPSVARVIDASGSNFMFTDNAEATTNVRIVGMTDGDLIKVTNAVAGDYNFQRDFTDINDLVITYTDVDTGATNIIIIDEVLPASGAVSTLAAATATIGFDFLTFA
ncbi:MAG: hypothetical protein KDE32_06680 [Novosphingobium sp.]|nr:hypothetical protein [Novosphingobium sp.]